jgi:spoIIIJ-associated protein
LEWISGLFYLNKLPEFPPVERESPQKRLLTLNKMVMDQNIQRGKAWLEKLLSLMGISTQVRVEEKDATEMSAGIWLIIDETPLSPEQIQTFIGENGRNIDAIQYLANTLLHLGIESDNQPTYIIELAGYRSRRQLELLALTQEFSSKVKASGFPVEIPALSAAERRQIHSFLQKDPDLETESQGQEPDRRLVIRLRVPQVNFLGIARD